MNSVFLFLSEPERGVGGLKLRNVVSIRFKILRLLR